MKLEELLERVEPVSFDEFTSKSYFIQVLDNFPEFKEKLREELSLDTNREWIAKAEREKVYFIIYDDSWKKNPSPFPNSVRLNFVGVHRIPVVSIDLHKKGRS